MQKERLDSDVCVYSRVSDWGAWPVAVFFSVAASPVPPYLPFPMSSFEPPSFCHRIVPCHFQTQDTEPRPSPVLSSQAAGNQPCLGSARLGGAWVARMGPEVAGAGTRDSPVRAAGLAASRPRELTRPRVSAGIPAPALNMPVIFISLRQAAKAIPPVASAAATQCFPLVGRGNGGRPDFLITWC